ncbi:hypothetical protein RRG08_029756 [Elysia crispata]|uniref:Uncharacterized protein n=1 Tax=Elysia crispata TaxID=231223 RepID=A0AAE1B537_9GAST|nr:hypothetical protein RRG08_029756 [Elysia crispata]
MTETFPKTVKTRKCRALVLQYFINIPAYGIEMLETFPNKPGSEANVNEASRVQPKLEEARGKLRLAESTRSGSVLVLDPCVSVAGVAFRGHPSSFNGSAPRALSVTGFVFSGLLV